VGEGQCCSQGLFGVNNYCRLLWARSTLKRPHQFRLPSGTRLLRFKNLSPDEFSRKQLSAEMNIVW
jgi:hypothetical protein